MKFNYSTTTDKEPPIIGEMMADLMAGYKTAERLTSMKFYPALVEQFGSQDAAASMLMNAIASGATQLLVELAAGTSDPEASLREISKSLTMLPCIALAKEIRADILKQMKQKGIKV